MKRFSFRTSASHMLVVNPFALLSAECGEHRLATIAPNEYVPEPTPKLCQIVPYDIGDEDRRDIIYDVWANNQYIGGGFSSHALALAWAKGQGYTEEPSVYV